MTIEIQGMERELIRRGYIEQEVRIERQTACLVRAPEWWPATCRGSGGSDIVGFDKAAARGCAQALLHERQASIERTPDGWSVLLSGGKHPPQLRRRRGHVGASQPVCGDQSLRCTRATGC